MIIQIVVAFLLGVVLTIAGISCLACGALRVYIPDDPDESPYLYADLDRPISFICKKKLVFFRVDIRNISSHK